MTNVLFRELIGELDNDMRAQTQNIVLLLDNASGNTNQGMELNSVTVVFLPPNTTSVDTGTSSSSTL